MHKLSNAANVFHSFEVVGEIRFVEPVESDFSIGDGVNYFLLF